MTKEKLCLYLHCLGINKNSKYYIVCLFLSKIVPMGYFVRLDVCFKKNNFRAMNIFCI